MPRDGYRKGNRNGHWDVDVDGKGDWGVGVPGLSKWATGLSSILAPLRYLYCCPPLPLPPLPRLPSRRCCCCCVVAQFRVACYTGSPKYYVLYLYRIGVYTDNIHVHLSVCVCLSFFVFVECPLGAGFFFMSASSGFLISSRRSCRDFHRQTYPVAL